MNKLLVLLIVLVIILAACNKDGESESLPFPANAVPLPEVGETITFGDYGWKALDVKDGKILLLSELILEERRYSEKRNDVTWETCEIRQYLNGEFYESFGKSRGKIVKAANANPDNPWFGTAGGGDTEDYIFLLSLGEVAQYFGDSGKLDYPPEGFNLAMDDGFNSARIANKKDGKADWWWLRTPGGLSDGAAFVSAEGTVYISGNSVETKSGGVRPAMWVDLNGEEADEIIVPTTESESAGIGDMIRFGGYDWIVLDTKDDKILVLSEKVISVIVSDDKEKGEMMFTDGKKDTGVRYDVNDASEWEVGAVRAYLNKGLVYEVNESVARIYSTYVENPDNPWFGTKGGATTEDYMFALSLEEVVKYFGDSGQYSFRPDNAYSIDDKFNDSRIAYNEDGEACRWCLRTPGMYENWLVCVGVDGKINVDGVYDFGSVSVGIRPAMWLKK